MERHIRFLKRIAYDASQNERKKERKKGRKKERKKENVNVTINLPCLCKKNFQ
jgi:hypothetical protein